MSFKREIMDCACTTNEHVMIVTTFDDEPEVYLELHLSDVSFLKKLLYAVRYIFGYKCKYGCFEEVIFSRENIIGLENMVKHIKENTK